MSSLSSVYNSSSTLFTMDIYTRWIKPDAPPEHLVTVGRITTCVVAGISLLWLPVIDGQQGQLFIIAQEAMTHISPTLTTVFLLGILSYRVNYQGAIAGMIGGFVLGIVRLFLSFFVFKAACDAAIIDHHINTGNWFLCMNFNHFAMIICAVVSLISISVSLWFPPPPKEQVAKYVLPWPSCLCCYRRNWDLIQNEEGSKVDQEQSFPKKMEDTPVSYEREDENEQMDPEDSVPLESTTIKETLSIIEVNLDDNNPRLNLVLNILAVSQCFTIFVLILGFSGLFY